MHDWMNPLPYLYPLISVCGTTIQTGFVLIITTIATNESPRNQSYNLYPINLSVPE